MKVETVIEYAIFSLNHWAFMSHEAEVKAELLLTNCHSHIGAEPNPHVYNVNPGSYLNGIKRSKSLSRQYLEMFETQLGWSL